MKLRYSPVKYNEHSPACVGHKPDTEIIYVDENSISIDNEVYGFDPGMVAWPKVAQDTDGVILSASRDTSGELSLCVRRFYSSSCGTWDTGEYGVFNAGP